MTIYRYLCLGLIASHLCGCFTLTTLRKAKFDRRNDVVTSIDSCYTDSDTALVINFSGRIGGHKNAQYHIDVPVEAILAPLIREGKSIPDPQRQPERLAEGIPDPQQRGPAESIPDSLRKPHGVVHRIYHVHVETWEQRGRGICIELPRTAILKGPYTPPHATPIDTRIVDFSHKPAFATRLSMGPGNGTMTVNARHPVFAYYPYGEDSARYRALRVAFIAISIEASDRRRYNRYLLLPATAACDAALLPLELVTITTCRFPPRREDD